jgi:hypothetical protein
MTLIERNYGSEARLGADNKRKLNAPALSAAA